jgi:hypothetical protein
MRIWEDLQDSDYNTRYAHELTGGRYRWGPRDLSVRDKDVGRPLSDLLREMDEYPGTYRLVSGTEDEKPAQPEEILLTQTALAEDWVATRIYVYNYRGIEVPASVRTGREAAAFAAGVDAALKNGKSR